MSANRNPKEELLWNIKNGEIEKVKENLSQKTVNEELCGGRNALHYAADYGQIDVILCLLNKGADVNLPDKHGISPLLAAIWEGHKEVVELLIKRGANKTGVSPDGQKYADCAETDEIKLLLK